MEQPVNLRSRTARVVSAVVLAAGAVAGLAGTAHAHVDNDLTGLGFEQVGGNRYTSIGPEGANELRFSNQIRACRTTPLALFTRTGFWFNFCGDDSSIDRALRGARDIAGQRADPTNKPEHGSASKKLSQNRERPLAQLL